MHELLEFVAGLSKCRRLSTVERKLIPKKELFLLAHNQKIARSNRALATKHVIKKASLLKSTEAFLIFGKREYKMNLNDKIRAILFYILVPWGLKGFLTPTATLSSVMLFFFFNLGMTAFCWVLGKRFCKNKDLLKPHFMNSMNLQVTFIPLVILDQYCWTPYFDSLVESGTELSVFFIFVPLTFLTLNIFAAYTWIRCILSVLLNKNYTPRFIIKVIRAS